MPDHDPVRWRCVAAGRGVRGRLPLAVPGDRTAPVGRRDLRIVTSCRAGQGLARLTPLPVVMSPISLPPVPMPQGVMPVAGPGRCA